LIFIILSEIDRLGVPCTLFFYIGFLFECLLQLLEHPDNFVNFLLQYYNFNKPFPSHSTDFKIMANGEMTSKSDQPISTTPLGGQPLT
jgi:hypothetical protein